VDLLLRREVRARHQAIGQLARVHLAELEQRRRDDGLGDERLLGLLRRRGQDRLEHEDHDRDGVHGRRQREAEDDLVARVARPVGLVSVGHLHGRDLAY
jgi:hypothetical protein